MITLIKILLCLLTFFLTRFSSNLKILNNILTNLHYKTTLKLLHSSHPLRLRYFILKLLLETFSFNLLLKKFSKNEQEITQKFLSHKKNISELKNNKLMFLGDSHVEFFSRSKTFLEDEFFSNCFAIWLGPKTTLGIYYETNKKKIFNDILYLLKSNIRKDDKNLTIIWSSGTIDVRFFIFELFKRKIINSNKDMKELFEKGFDCIILDFLIPLKLSLNKSFPNVIVNIALSFCSNTLEKGENPQTKKEIDFFKKNMDFPTFGSIYERQKWVEKINHIIAKKCKANNIFCYEHMLNNKISISSKFTYDNIHLTDPEQIDKANYKILNKIKCVKNVQ